ncbi:HAMP domain-containing protein [Paenibacillus sp. LMG 31458]|uniref:histidine kinase n=1 Tax=Paenibacillus phytorum TaxID=2654977 RepID=A0ABX1Y8S2_9BACL|nr:sensor histidine kinase [Paenibacillus phytorum]NOU76824.1 HAMP domain-containing protein [Paenibacillus phytorum]
MKRANRIHAFQFTSIRQKLFLSYILLIVIPIVVLGLYSYYQSKLLLQKQALQGIRETIRTISDNMDYKADQYNRIMDSIVYNTGILKIFNNDYTDVSNLSYDLRSYLDPTFNTIKGMNKEIMQLTVYTQNKLPEYGDFIQNSSRVAETNWYRSASANVNTEWYWEDGNLIVARKIPDIFQLRNPSTVSMNLTYSKMFEGLQSKEMNNFGIVVRDKNSNVVYSNSDYLNQRLLFDAMGKSSKSGNHEYFIIDEQIQHPSWTLSYYIPLNEVSINATSIIKATVIIVLVCFSILLLMIWMFSNMFTVPIKRLIHKMKLIENGNLDVVVSSNSIDEFGILTNRFGQMLQKINELILVGYQNKIDQQKAEFKALQSQINPHFLYNTLSAIKWKSVQAGQEEISKIVTSLSKFYRTALNKGDNIIPVREEVVNMKSYVEIMLIMSESSFDVHYDFDEDIFLYVTINLILQPVVENCIEHGIAGKTDGRGKIAITGRSRDGYIEITVEDNGVGMTEEKAREVLSRESRGYGLKNVNDRLKLFFGEGYGISIESVLGKGTVMTIRLPKREELLPDM